MSYKDWLILLSRKVCSWVYFVANSKILLFFIARYHSKMYAYHVAFIQFIADPYPPFCLSKSLHSFCSDFTLGSFFHEVFLNFSWALVDPCWLSLPVISGTQCHSGYLLSLATCHVYPQPSQIIQFAVRALWCQNFAHFHFIIKFLMT